MPEVYEHIDSNGTSESKDTNVTFDVNSSGKQADISFLFIDAGDAQTILYDPWITGQSEGSGSGSGSGSGAPINSISLSLTLCFIFFHILVM